ncbi:SRPBCC family protein [Deinococcus aquaedulcis]|uniref:SRPBCC family protein n=1 Tax=Deinococcus aquaedulcis TaxID=2840455 RepID=UPI001C836B8E|nr:SRPBCC family protein [Deinococcus aquaedulcis]
MKPLGAGALLGGAAGVLYGLGVYLWLHVLDGGDGGAGVMVASYLFLVPFVLGLLSVTITLRLARPHAPAPAPDPFGDPPPARPSPLGEAMGVAALTTTVFLVTALVVGFEGVLCAFIAAPVMYVMAALGAGTAFLAQRWWRRGRAGALLLTAALPAVLGPLEQRLTPPSVYRTVTNSVLVHAPPEAVWAQIRSVPRIQDREIQTGWAHLAGLPRPREAVLTGTGVGAARLATFDGALSFLETVTDWQEERLLSFRIQARDPGGLDPHVRVGGRFFDVLSGTYRLEEIEPGVTLLHLSSTQRLSTPFNGYAAYFTQAIMHDLQRTILDVVRDRAEAQALMD